MKIWFQKADFSYEHFDNVAFEEAMEHWEKRDWSMDLALQEKLAADKCDHCKPGMGIVSDKEELLHLVPNDNTLESWSVSKKYVRRQWLLFVKWITRHNPKVKREHIEPLIREFYQ